MSLVFAQLQLNLRNVNLNLTCSYLSLNYYFHLKIIFKVLKILK